MDPVRCSACRHCEYVTIQGQYGIFKACTHPEVVNARGKPVGAVIDGKQCNLYSRGSPGRSCRVVA